ncbi:hypothetical protein BD626DRAFT_488101 [Schizophyllum amplum]|uniref:Uncharacterized protein n=1 Tax=Schizophyllum amplum TaxID=97359 RepID=A0A550CK79_9AGAR|nr:hypothetical protein BD626DRAFT_488101 [Auriculariopsis ampla]
MPVPVQGLRTRLTQLLNIRTPVICAPMAGASGGRLSCCIPLQFPILKRIRPPGADPPEKLRDELSLATKNLPARLPGARLPIGVGFVGWQLDAAPQATELVRMALEHHVAAIWLAFGTNASLANWARFIRTHEPDDKRTQIFFQTASPEDARTAVNEWDVDIVVAQGCESGGHGFADAPPIITLLPAMRAALPDHVPVLVAGGLALGSQLACMLAMGASGAVFGTLFGSQRHALLSANSQSTMRTMAFDHARGTLGWPAGVDGRGLRNDTVADFENGDDHEEIRRKYRSAVEQNDTSRTIVWAGTGVGLMETVKPAKDVVEELHADCVRHLGAVTRVCIPTQ